MESSFESFRLWDTHVTELMQIEGCKDHRLSLGHLNVRSIHKHWDQLMMLMTNRLQTLDILILSEVNTDESACTSFTLPGFHSHCLCRKGRRGGGLIMFVSDAWCSDNLDVSFQHAETLVVRIYKINISYVIFALYRPPSSNVQLFCDEFSEALKKYDNNEHLVIAGDFNIDVLD